MLLHTLMEALFDGVDEPHPGPLQLRWRGSAMLQRPTLPRVFIIIKSFLIKLALCVDGFPYREKSEGGHTEGTRGGRINIIQFFFTTYYNWIINISQL